MDPEKKHLQDLSKFIHDAVRMLKMGETASISCSKYPAEDVRNYLMAYSFHKKKWFETKYDKTSKLLTAKRAPPPPWEREEEAPEEA